MGPRLAARHPYGLLDLSAALCPALAAAAGVPDVSPHRSRHTLATRLLKAGMAITGLQKLLGHEYLSTTHICARVYDSTVEADYRQAMAKVEHLHLHCRTRRYPLTTGRRTGRRY